MLTAVGAIFFREVCRSAERSHRKLGNIKWIDRILMHKKIVRMFYYAVYLFVFEVDTRNMIGCVREICTFFMILEFAV
jgi:hypothetical protein